MTCQEFERAMPESDGYPTVDQAYHLTSCAECSELVEDLKAISRQARLLQDSHEPAARVWNSIEIALRREGLIREPQSAPFLVHSGKPGRWRLAWLIPVTAVVLLTFGVLRYERAPAETAKQTPVLLSASSEIAASASEDQQFLDAVSRRTPAMRASYEANLRDVNSYISDAEESAKENPNDEQAQQYLMSAYEQKTMVYDIALNRSVR